MGNHAFRLALTPLSGLLCNQLTHSLAAAAQAAADGLVDDEMTSIN